MDRLLSKEIFVAAVEMGSFTAVANHFRLSPPMISKHIRELEKRIGASLLNRTTRRQHLTEIGEEYYAKCKEILHQIADLNSDTSAKATRPTGKLRISAPVWYGMSTLAPVIASYLHSYPDVDIELILNDRYVDPVSDGFDVLVRIGQLENSSMIARSLPDYELMICASPDYIKRYGKPNTPEDLVSHQCLHFTSWITQGGWRKINKHVGRHTTSRVTSNNVQVIRQAALKGLGLVMMPVSLLAEDIAAGRLVEVLTTHRPRPKPVNLLFAEKARSTSKITSFVNFVSDYLSHQNKD